MKISRRNAITVIAGAPALLLPRKSLAQDVGPEIEKGPFNGTREALKAYQVPQWFRDAKFGIWAHWGPQSAAEDGDWYARNIYIQGSPQNKDHVARFGHPSKFGHKDICKMWTADKFDPDHLMQLYKKAGAKYFMSMGVHHDNFDLWDSKHQPRWNSVAMGPKKDIVGLWEKAARKQGLRFAVSEHLAYSYLWWTVSHGSDQTGPMAGVPYDGADPQYADLYHEYAKEFLVPEPGGQVARRTPRSTRVETTLLRPHQGLDRQAPTRPALQRRRHCLPGGWLPSGVPSLQREREGPRRQGGGRLYEQGTDRLRHRHLCLRH